MKTIIGRISNIARLPSSRDGNPRYSCTLTDDRGIDYQARTAPDSGIAYGFLNHAPKRGKPAPRMTWRVRLLRGHWTIAAEPEPAAELVSVNPRFTFDGSGINGPDDYRTRFATLTTAGLAGNVGELLAAAPELRELLDAVLRSPDAAVAMARAGFHGQIVSVLARTA